MKWQIREIRIIDLLRYLLLPALTITASWVLCFATLSLVPTVPPFLPYLLSGIATCLLMRFFLIGLVLLYKAFAPMSVRDRCRFEPSCSTYMIMALQKYGALVGLIKGIARICRCKPPNGGVDLP